MPRTFYTAHATVVGGRTGHGRTDDGALDVELRPPAEGGGTNPEQLFAIGYGACFASALGVCARRARIESGPITVDVRVHLNPFEDRRYALSVDLDVHLPELHVPEEAVALVAQAHRVCPYSNATRGNIAISLTANGNPVQPD